MAEGLLRHMAGDKFEVHSAGSHPSHLHPASVAVMAEWGIDIARHTAEPIEVYLDTGIDIAITVCDNAQQICPTFPGNVKRIHWGLDDPYHGWGAKPEDLLPYREIRDELKGRIKVFLTEQNKKVKG